jgi:hypothetical protein
MTINQQPDTCMNLKLCLIFISVILIATISCKKKKLKPTHMDVYFAGRLLKYSYQSKTGNYISTAAYWKNSVPTMLADTLTDSRVNGIAVNGKDVYMVGYVKDNATCWKNGIPTALGKGCIYGVAIINNDVYMAGVINGGYEGDRATFWKNGVPTTLGKGVIFSMTDDGNDIYMAGYKSMPVIGSPVATYWKNNKAVALNDTLSGSTEAWGIFVQNGDVYAVGSLDNQTVPVYWKNSDLTNLTGKSQSLSGSADAIYVQGGDVYVAGSIESGNYTFAPVYWKNGKCKRLTHSGIRSFASAIAVQDSDVYVAGSDNYFPVYWKNGTAVHLGKDRGQIYAMAISGY